MADKPKYRSVSQRNTYDRCPYRYKLERIDKVWQRPASWLSQGLGVHKAMEEWELSDRTKTFDELVEIYKEEFAKSIAEQAEDTPNFEFWFGSGRYNGEQDIERRWHLGIEQVGALVRWANAHPEQKIWTTPDGEKAIELRFDVEIGGIPVVGYIDQVVETPDGLMVRDIKTGAKPGDIFQLATYAEAMKLLYDVDIEAGDYFMGKTGKPTKTLPITPEDKAFVHEDFARLEEKIQAEDFPPKPSRNNCTMCAVKTSCEFREA